LNLVALTSELHGQKVARAC